MSNAFSGGNSKQRELLTTLRLSGGEVIAVPKAAYDVVNGGICLLRSKLVPEAAFVMWNYITMTTSGRVGVRATCGDSSRTEMVGQYQVVCACCPNETRSYERSSEHTETWVAERVATFAARILEVCQDKGINTLFMRKAERWRDRYQDSCSIALVEVTEHLRHVGTLGGYDLRHAYEAFIDYRQSRDLEARSSY